MFDKEIHHVGVADSVHCWNQDILKFLPFTDGWLDEFVPVTPRASADLLKQPEHRMSIIIAQHILTWLENMLLQCCCCFCNFLCMVTQFLKVALDYTRPPIHHEILELSLFHVICPPFCH